MPDQLMEFKTSLPARLIMLLTVLLALILSWFALRWYIGNTLAEYFNPDSASLPTAEMAVSLAPNDPLPHWRLGDHIRKTLPPDQLSRAVPLYERAVSLSPNDYRFWMEMGEALEQAGEYERAEKALREAVRLAPSYAYPRWYLGNLLIRIDRYPDAFAELRKASDAYAEFQPQLFSLAWQLYKDDFESLQDAVGRSPQTRAAFAKYLLTRGRYDEGLRLWNTQTEQEKRANRATADAIIASLSQGHQYHHAVTIWNSVAPGIAYQAEIGKVIDGSFEGNVAHGTQIPFSWQVSSLPQVQTGITPTLGHSGSRSLRIFFQVSQNLESVILSQLVPVTANTDYEFEYYVRTEKLVSAATPLVTVADAAGGSPLAISPGAGSGDKDWQQIVLPLRTGPNTQALIVKVVRPSCGSENPVCPLFGTVWYDDFNLSRK